jgi:hypothetical protein
MQSIRIRCCAVLALAMSLTLAGCGPDSDTDASPVPAPSEETPNVAPVISGTPPITATAGIPWAFQPAASDADGDPLVFFISGQPGWADFDARTGRLAGMPSATDIGVTASIVITVSDGQVSASLPAFSLEIQPATPPADPEPAPQPTPTPTPTPAPTPIPAPITNTAPVISGTPATTVQATRPYSFTPVASDAETPQRLVFSISNRPSWASFSTTTGTLSGTPSASDVGTWSNIRIRVSDGSLSTSLPAFSITVTAPPNRAPVISGTPPARATVGSAYSFRPRASDPDGQRLRFSIVNQPAWATFSTTTGTLAGTPGAQHVGTTSGIVIRVSDGTNTVELPAFSITVEARENRPPSIGGTPSSSARVGVAYVFRPSASDPDGDRLSWSITGKPDGAVFSTSTGELAWTPTTEGNWQGIIITVTDSNGASASLPAFSISVASAPATGTGAASLSWTPPSQYTDGSPLPLSSISAYRIYHGTSPSGLERLLEVGASTTQYTVGELASGTHYFAVTAVTVEGFESPPSQTGSKTIP